MNDLIPLTSILAIILAGFLLIFGLFSAPWQILLLLLATGLVGMRWLTNPNRFKTTPQEAGWSSVVNSSPEQPEHATPHPLQEQPLSYRGAAYKPISTPEAIAEASDEASNVEISGKYRGGVWRKLSNPASTPPKAGRTEILGKYRGCIWKPPN